MASDICARAISDSSQKKAAAAAAAKQDVRSRSLKIYVGKFRQRSESNINQTKEAEFPVRNEGSREVVAA